MFDMIIIPNSSNSKTGNIVQSYSARWTCPNRCPLKGNGCYAGNYPTGVHWDRCDNPEDTRYVGSERELRMSLLSAVAEHAKKEDVVMFRHNVAGDIALQDSNEIDGARLEMLSEACMSASEICGVEVKGYTYTHCEINNGNAREILKAQQRGFIVNFSCETPEEVLKSYKLGCNAVITSVNPEETKTALREMGIHSVQCPAQTKEGVSCATCRLCARNRESVIIFAVHGASAGKAKKVIMLKNAR